MSNTMNLEHFLPKMPLKPPWPPQLPESFRKPPRYLPFALESKKNIVWVLVQGLFQNLDKLAPMNDSKIDQNVQTVQHFCR